MDARIRTRALIFLAYLLGPILIILASVLAVFVLPASYSYNNGTALETRFLADEHALDLEQAHAGLQNQAFRLSALLPAEKFWLLIHLPDTGPQYAVRGTILLPGHALEQTVCQRLVGGQNRNNAWLPLKSKAAPMGTEILLPELSGQVLCQATLLYRSKIAPALWLPDDLAMANTHHALLTGLLQGSFLALALLLFCVALSTHEWTYAILSLWLLGTMQLGAWALGMDHQWLGHSLTPNFLPWLRKLTLAAYFLLSCHLFIRLSRDSLDSMIRKYLPQTVNAAAVLFLLALVILPARQFEILVFLAAWFCTGLICIMLIHALARASSRTRLWMLSGTALGVSTILIGMILIGLGQQQMLHNGVSVALLLLSSLLVSLAVAHQIREARQENLRQLNELITRDSLTPLGMFALGPTRNFEHLSPNARQFLQLEADADLAGLAWSEYFPELDWQQVSQATNNDEDTEIEMHPLDGGPARRFLLRATQSGNRIEGSLQDISARSETIRNLRLMADRDPLTDTLNRRGIVAAMHKSLAKLQESGVPTALAYLELDHLKRATNLFGHSAADTLLQMICERLRYSLGEQQQLGRVESDEFIILFPNMQAREAETIGRDIIESLNGSPIYVGERAFHIKSAMGLIDLDPGMQPKDAIVAASRACREARKSHQDIVLYEEDAEELFDHLNELSLFEQIERKGMPDDLYLELQPILSLHDPYHKQNFEALLRVRQQHDRHKLSTSRVIQAAEDNGMITAIDKWVFSKTLNWLAENHALLNNTQYISINLSGVSLNDDHFIDVLFDILSQQPQFSRRICVEITESVALQDLERTRQFMRRLQRMGGHVALDDFGAGYTSFSYLKELPADIIKIDGSLVQDMLASESNIAIVSSILRLAHNLGMQCVAEWVEDIATLRALADMGMDYVQGYAVAGSHLPGEILAQQNATRLIKDSAVRAFIDGLAQGRGAQGRG